ncbi:hypothetical protein G4B88_008014 [Cannabis sativa]|uniref:Amine oxidase domain-containing protein n=1 Tax=Cannabis sativa TaxID=3483 RepID=A0A7J6I8K0_CANSA|nr:hypothetical protein G4B88_008014 [Cannabis sativa]
MTLRHLITKNMDALLEIMSMEVLASFRPLTYSEILKMLQLWGLLDFDVKIFVPHDFHSLPPGYHKQKRIFFDRDLETTSRLFDFIFKSLALGDSTIPAKGIEEIPKQLAAKLPSDSIRFNFRAISIDSEGFDSLAVILQTGELLRNKHEILAPKLWALSQVEKKRSMKNYEDAQRAAKIGSEDAIVQRVNAEVAKIIQRSVHL